VKGELNLAGALCCIKKNSLHYKNASSHGLHTMLNAQFITVAAVALLLQVHSPYSSA
jgi:hypothetical protein